MVEINKGFNLNCKAQSISYYCILIESINLIVKGEAAIDTKYG